MKKSVIPKPLGGCEQVTLVVFKWIQIVCCTMLYHYIYIQSVFAHFEGHGYFCIFDVIFSATFSRLKLRPDSRFMAHDSGWPADSNSQPSQAV